MKRNFDPHLKQLFAFQRFHTLSPSSSWSKGQSMCQCSATNQPSSCSYPNLRKRRKKACFSKKPCVEQSYSHFFNCIHLQNLMKLQVSAVNTYPVSPNLYLWHWHCCWLLDRAGFRWLGMMRPDRSKEAPME